MNSMLAIIKRELHIFSTPIVYVFICYILILSGVFALLRVVYMNAMT
jgi:hypothetical protein